MSRARRGQGSLHRIKTPQGYRWRARRTVYYDSESGKQTFVSGTAASPEEAIRRCDINYKKHLIKTGEAKPSILANNPEAVRTTVTDTIYGWYNQINPQEVSDITRRGYLTRAELHIIPHIGTLPVRLLTREHIQQLFYETLPNKKKKDGITPLLSGYALANIYKVLSMSLEWATRRGDIPANPAKQVKAPKRQRKREYVDQKGWVPEYLLKKLEGQEDEARWLLAFLYGLRQSEALGLTDSSLRLTGSNPRIIIKQQLARYDVRHGCGRRDPVSGEYPCGQRTAGTCSTPIGGGGYYIKAVTKTEAGERTLPLTPYMAKVLKRHMKRVNEVRQSKAFDPLPGPEMDKLVFITDTGKPVRQTVDTRRWRALLETYNIEHIRGHLTRHITATLLADLQVPLEITKKIIGHSSEAMTAYYTHISSKKARDPLANLEERITVRQEWSKEAKRKREEAERGGSGSK